MNISLLLIFLLTPFTTKALLIFAEVSISADYPLTCFDRSGFTFKIKLPAQTQESVFTGQYSLKIKLPFDFKVLNPDFLTSWENNQYPAQAELQSNEIDLSELEFSKNKLEYTLRIENVKNAIQSTFIENMGRFEVIFTSDKHQVRGHSLLDIKRSQALDIQANFIEEKTDTQSCLDISIQHGCSTIIHNTRVIVTGPSYNPHDNASERKTMFNMLNKSICPVRLNGDEIPNICLHSGESMKLYDIFLANYDRKDINLQLCNLRTPISTGKYCGFKITFYVSDYITSPYLEEEFCVQVTTPKEFTTLELDPDNAMINSEFNVNINLDSAVDYSLKTRQIQIDLPSAIGTAIPDGSFLVEIPNLEQSPVITYEEHPLHRITIKNIEQNSIPDYLILKKLKSPLTPQVTLKGIRVSIVSQSGNPLLSSITPSLSFHYPIIKINSIISSNPKRGFFTNLTFNLNFLNYGAHKLNDNIDDIAKLEILFPQELDSSLFQSFVGNKAQNEYDVLNFQILDDNSCDVVVNGVFNPINYLETGPIRVILRRLESNLILYQSTDSDSLSSKLKFKKTKILNFDSGIGYKAKKETSLFSLFIDFDLQEAVPEDTELLLEFSTNLKYIIDFNSPCVKSPELNQNPYCSFNKNKLIIQNLFQGAKPTSQLSFEITRLSMPVEVNSSIQVTLSFFTNNQEFYEKTEFTISTGCPSSCSKCLSKNRDHCLACTQNHSLSQDFICELERKNNFSEIEFWKQFLSFTPSRYLSFGLVFGGIVSISAYIQYIKSVWKASLVEMNISKKIVSVFIFLELILVTWISYKEMKGYMFFICIFYWVYLFFLNLTYIFKLRSLSKSFKLLKTRNCFKRMIFGIFSFVHSGYFFSLIQRADKVAEMMFKKNITMDGTLSYLNDQSTRSTDKTDSQTKNRPKHDIFLFFKSLKKNLLIFNTIFLAIFTIVFISLCFVKHSFDEIFFEFIVMLIFFIFIFSKPIYKNLATVKNEIEKLKYMEENDEESGTPRKNIEQISEEPSCIYFQPNLDCMKIEVNKQMHEIKNQQQRVKRSGSLDEMEHPIEPFNHYLKEMEQKMREKFMNLDCGSSSVSEDGSQE